MRWLGVLLLLAAWLMLATHAGAVVVSAAWVDVPLFWQLAYFVPASAWLAGSGAMLLAGWLASGLSVRIGRDAAGRGRGRGWAGRGLRIAGGTAWFAMLAHALIVDRGGWSWEPPLADGAHAAQGVPAGATRVLRLVHWNAMSPDVIPGPAMWALAGTTNADVLLFSAAMAPHQYADVEKGFDPSYTLVRRGMFVVASKWPVRDARLLSLGLAAGPSAAGVAGAPARSAELAASRRWLERVYQRVAVPLGMMPRRFLNVDPGHLLAVDLDVSGVVVTVWYVDLPSDPLLPRGEVMRAVRQRVETARAVEARAGGAGVAGVAGEGPWREPDVLLGDLNTPRGMRCVRTLAPGLRDAWASAARRSGWTYTFPRGLPLTAIDHARTGARVRARAVSVVDPGVSEHRALVLDAEVPATPETTPEPAPAAEPAGAASTAAERVALVAREDAMASALAGVSGARGARGVRGVRGAVASSLEGGRLSLTDATGRVIFGGGRFPVDLNAEVTPTVRVSPRVDGVDLTFRYRNTSGTARWAGKMVLDGLRLGPRPLIFNLRQGPLPERAPGYGHSGSAEYPGVYSPAMVFREGDVVVSASVLYPAGLYDEPLGVGFGSEVPAAGREGRGEGRGEEGGGSWFMVFTHRGKLAPGADRTYTVAVRVARVDDGPRAGHWLETLRTYRDYFRLLHGRVAYERDPRPAAGLPLAFPGTSTRDNPRGFADASLRPDVHGLGPLARTLERSVPGTGFERVMIWAPSGVFAESDLNYPFLFMTGLLDFPKAAATVPELARAGEVVELGYWWGRSSAVMRGWEATSFEPLDPDDPEHVALALAELDLARRCGARMIGLDAFVFRGPGTAARWLTMMQRHAPEVRFITEQAAEDGLHRLAPTFHEASVQRGPHVLADLLNPGHETWAAIHAWDRPRGGGPRAEGDVDRVGTLERLARMGLVAMPYQWFEIPASRRGSVRAAASWRRTIPPGLREAWQTRGIFGAADLAGAGR